MYNILIAYWNFLNEFSPYLLLGFIIAGFLHGLVNDIFIQKNLLGNKFINILKASLIGIPLPLCSCGVIPVAMSLYKKGASKASTASFLISTPQTGVDSILVTYGALKTLGVPNAELWAGLRPIVALIAGLFGGFLLKIFDKDTHSDIEDCPHETKSIKDMLKYGLITLPQDIAKPLLIGIFLASIIAINPPDELIRTYITYGGFVELFTILIFSIPLYVCATASIPLALSLVGTGSISFGGALIFLMAGPVTNVATITTIYKVLGKKLVMMYLLSVTTIAMLFGYGINSFYPNITQTINWGQLMEGHTHHHMGLLNYISSIFILLILLNAILKPFNKKIKGSDMDTKINVEGMTCNHCKESVTKAILIFENVEGVNIDLDSGDVFISGSDINVDEICNAIKNLGFKIN